MSGTINGTLYINISLSGAVASVQNVVINGSSSGEGQVVPALPSALGPGRHADTITVRACTTDINCTSGNLSGSPRTIEVTYTINGIRTATTSLAYTIGDAPASTDLVRQVPLSGFPADVSWTATSNASWLTVPAGGALVNSTGQLTASIDQMQLDALVNDSYTATITLTPASGDVVTVPVTLNVNRTEISYVSPYVAVAGASREVVIRGDNFPSTANVSFGGWPALNVNRVSATEIRATYPAELPVGSHPVQVAGVPRSRATLVAVDVPEYAVQRLDFPAGFTPTRMTYDAERQALLIVLAHDISSANNEFVRFSYTSGVWGAAERHPTFNLTDMALSVDGAEWLATRFSPISVQHYDAASLSLRATVLDANAVNSAYHSRLAVANDGFAITGGRDGPACAVPSRYRIRTQQYFRFASVSHACSSFMAASADGSTIIAGNNFNGDIDRYVASTQEFAALSPSPALQLTSAPVLDRHATRIVLNTTHAYAADFSLLGQLPPSTKAVVISPDGTIAWTYEHPDQVRKFDLVAVPSAGFLQEVGSPTSLGASPDSNGDGGIVMTTTPEGEVLFIAGDDGVLVQPSP